MKFISKKGELLKGFSRIQGITGKKHSMPILVNALLEASKEKLNIYATDLEVGIVGSYQAEVIEEGKLVIPARKTYDIIRELPDKAIKFEGKEENFVEIFCGKTHFRFTGLSSNEFPSVPNYKERDLFKIKSEIMGEMMEKTIHAIPKEEAMSGLGGAFIKMENSPNGRKVKMIATDGHRLSLIERKVDEEGGGGEGLKEGVIFPRKGIYELNKLLDREKKEVFKVGITENSLIFKGDEIILSARLLSGEFPDYQQVMPKETKNKVKLNRHGFLSSLRRVSTLLSDRNKGVKLSFKEGRLEVVSIDPEFGEGKDEMEIDYQGDETEIGFNPYYLIDVLNIINKDNIIFEFNDNSNPILIKPYPEEAFLSIIMPMIL